MKENITYNTIIDYSNKTTTSDITNEINLVTMLTEIEEKSTWKQDEFYQGNPEIKKCIKSFDDLRDKINFPNFRYLNYKNILVTR